MEHAFGGELMRDNLRAVAALIAVAMVAIVMRVHHCIDFRRRFRLGFAHRVQHVARQGHVEQRVDEKRLSTIDDETCIGPAPAAIGLQPGIAAIAEIVQTFRILKPAQAQTHDFLPKR